MPNTYSVKPGSKWLRGKFHKTLLLKTVIEAVVTFLVTDKYFEACFFTFVYSWNLWYTLGYRCRSKIMTTVIYRETADRTLWVKCPLCRKQGCLLRLKECLSPRDPKFRFK